MDNYNDKNDLNLDVSYSDFKLDKDQPFDYTKLDYVSEENLNNIEIAKYIKIKKSLLDDKQEFLNLIKMKLIQRMNAVDAPYSFDVISRYILEQIKKIDDMQQKNQISRDGALELIADLFESEGNIKRYEEYVDNLIKKKLRQMHKYLQIKYEGLLYALNCGLIDEKEFMRRYSLLRRLVSNTHKEIMETRENLHPYTK